MANSKAKTPKRAKSRQVPEEFELLMAAAFGEIESGYLDEIRDNPDGVLEKRDFSQTIQSIYGGGFAKAKDTLPLLEMLAPFADGRLIALRIAEEAKAADATAASIMNELVDAFAVSAINIFATAIVALAVEKPEKMPAVAAPYESYLKPHAASLRQLLTKD